ncbi:MAG TPA: DNA topoisomerase IV subunit A [Acidobacteriota bacterium]|nr:DNA topoisomerase IV subunit A [Acidobacteriota bacterium]
MTDGQKELPLFGNAGLSSDTGSDASDAMPADADKARGLLATGDGPLKKLMNDNFLRYAAYVIRDRAIPDLDDGLKPVQRRILYSLHENDDGKFIKVANIVGYCMQFHPHGDASIGDALVALANRQYLIERQGNFGNVLTGDPPAAARYIECRLTELARTELFNSDLTEFVSSYDGRKKEPVTLPAKIPLLLLLGAEGIAVGISTRILPHNFSELLEAQIAILNKKPFVVLPDFPQGGLMDAEAYDDGRGHVLVRASIEKKNERTLVIRELPFGATTDSLMTSIEDAARRGKIKIKSLNDFTAGQAEIEIQLPPDQDAGRAIEALYAFTQCQMQIASRITVIRDNKPVEMDVPGILRYSTARLVEILRRELARRRRRLAEEMHHQILVRLFVEKRIYRLIEKCDSSAAILQAVLDGLQPFREQLQRDLTREDAEGLLGIPIRRISLLDLDRNQKDIERLREELAEVEQDLAALVPYAIRYLRGLLRKYGPDYPRRTRLATFGEISERELTANELEIAYDREKGYIGHKIAGSPLLSCSPLDKLLLVWRDGRCKVVSPPEKLFVDTSMMYCAVADRERVMSAVFEWELFTRIKKFAAGALITNRDYRIAPKGSHILFLADDCPPVLYVRYAADTRSKIRQQEFGVGRVPVRDRDAKGLVMTARHIEFIGASKPADWDDSLTGPPGRFSDLP